MQTVVIIAVLYVNVGDTMLLIFLTSTVYVIHMYTRYGRFDVIFDTHINIYSLDCISFDCAVLGSYVYMHEH